MNEVKNQALILAEQFRIENFKRTGKNLPIKIFLKEKWWNHFVKTATLYKDKPEWDPRLFIKTIFAKYDIPYPYHLSWKNTWKIYLEYKDFVNSKGIDYVSISKTLLNDWKKIKRYFGEKEINLPEFFNNRNNIEKIKRGFLSIHFLSLCKTFKELNDQYLYIDHRTLFAKRLVILKNKKINDKMKEILGNEFLEEIKGEEIYG